MVGLLGKVIGAADRFVFKTSANFGKKIPTYGVKP